MKLTPVVSGLDSPIAVAWRTHDTRMFVAEQPGRVRAVDAGGNLLPAPVLTVGPLSHGNEEGLLGIAFSPDGSKLYVDYTDPDDDTHVDEYTMSAAGSGGVADASTRRRLLVVPQPYSNHKGGEVVTGPDGMLYIGLGDGGSEGDPDRNGQNLGVLLSKILRIDPAAKGSSPYSVPSDNPFVGRAGVATRDVDVGPAQPVAVLLRPCEREPLDRRRRAEPVRGGRLRPRRGRRHQLGLERAGGLPRVPRLRTERRARDPLLETRHSDGTCAVVGGYVYRGKAIPALDGVYVFGDNCRPELVGAVAGTTVTRRDLGPKVPALTSFGEDPAGEIYAIARAGTVYRLAAA